MSEPSGFNHLMPGFEFLQGLATNAGGALPGIGTWVAPTVDPAEIEKRIEELRTVQFWLEQNVRMVGATIQALEVQRLTLSTLKTMNVQMEDLRDSLKIRMPGAAADDKPDSAQAHPAAEPAAGADPMQWWGALTRQFTELATRAMKDGVGVGAAAPAASSANAAEKKTARPASPKKPAARPRRP
jgi:hypothetical protein